MATIISIYDKLRINKITYEMGDSLVLAECQIRLSDGATVDTTIKMSHTDLNRILSKLSASGVEVRMEQRQYTMTDGTSVIQYAFENVYGQPAVVEDFEFRNEVTEIRA